MGEFVDQYMSAKVPGYPCASSPRTKTTIQVNAGGGERRNQDWEHPLHRFTLPEAAGRDWSVIESLMKHWRIMRGPFRSFPWRDPLDKASIDLRIPDEPDADLLTRISSTDQAIGTGTGFTDTFQLMKTYAVGPETYARPIYLPVLSSVLVAADGVLVPGADYSVSRPGGVIAFDLPPADGVEITAGFLFDVEVRFESDDAFDAILRTYAIGGFADITLIEVRPC
jgi:uncharacterized protein (TIGR02217 family)